MPDRDLQLVIDTKSSIPAYRQIVDQIRHWLVSGTLKPGATLPSVRRLAIDLGVHHNTIAEAYRVLADEGWLEVAQGKAACVLERTAALPPRRSDRQELQTTFSRRLRHLIAEMRANGLPEDWITAELHTTSGIKE